MSRIAQRMCPHCGRIYVPGVKCRDHPAPKKRDEKVLAMLGDDEPSN